MKCVDKFAIKLEWESEQQLEQQLDSFGAMLNCGMQQRTSNLTQKYGFNFNEEEPFSAQKNQGNPFKGALTKAKSYQLP